MKMTLHFLALTGLILLGSIAPNVDAAAAPNVVLFLVDDLGVFDSAYNGSPFYLTPNTDQLSAEGMNFDMAYCAHPRCVPSRYGIMTGRFPARGGVPGDSYGLEAERVSIGQAMSDAGYATWYIGKWHLTEKDGSGTPDERGFDVNIAGGPAGAPASYSYPYNIKKNGKEAKEKAIEGLDEGSQEGDMLTDRLTQEAEQLIRNHAGQNSDQPFFLTLSHYGVHTPFEDSQERIKMFRKRLKKDVPAYDGPELMEIDGTTKQHHDNETYAAMIYRVDESLGRIVAVLEELGLGEDTVIVFTSDHGGLSNRGLTNGRQLATSNLPLRAGKGHLLEGGVRVPMIFKWPGKVAAGGHTDARVVGNDIYPTLLELAGKELRPEEHIDGRSFAATLYGKTQADRDPIYWHNPRPRPGSTGDFASSAVRDGDFKLIHWYPTDSLELYNIAEDPEESQDLAGDHPEITQKLKQQLDAWLKEVDAVEVRIRSNDDD